MQITKYFNQILLIGGIYRRPSTTGTTPHRSSPSSVSVPVLSKQMQFKEPSETGNENYADTVDGEVWFITGT